MLTTVSGNANQPSFLKALGRAVRKLTAWRPKSIPNNMSDPTAAPRTQHNAQDMRAHIEQMRMYYGAGL